ncbi:PREDICTED: gastrula zinc finger protein xFG20-1-like [Vollenhovia emeryi]|uniref:gastrula zinc finger protein xFG20-1-like n=1 Tax=Vollenhovia emeryi TaxID=411798 RepID=UPI0005F546DA|nr:PREDICTED: gastrula zinc finger protein xFG20-1-like [Vollenhovia emeryi]
MFQQDSLAALTTEDLSITGLKWAAAWQRWSVPSIMWRSGAGLGKGLGSSLSNPEGFNCPACGRVYKLKSSLRNHQKWECGKEPQFQCPHCVYKAKQKMHIARHMERMHKEKIYKQELVSRNYSKSDRETRKTALNGLKVVKKFPQSCPGKTAIYTIFLAAMQPQVNTVLGTDSRGLSPAFRYASYIHTRPYPHASFFAGLGWTGEGSRRVSRSANSATTTSSSTVASDVPAPLTPQRRPRLHCPSRHTASRNNNHPSISSSGGLMHHDRRHNCSRCGKSYKNAYILKRHLQYECGKAPSFSCPHCAFSSKYERNLKAHINHRHVDLQPALSGIVVGVPKRYPCFKCGRIYKARGSLKRHLNDECGKDPKYVCVICERGFKQKTNFKRHAEKVHHCQAATPGRRSRAAIKKSLKHTSFTAELWPLPLLKMNEQP